MNFIGGKIFENAKVFFSKVLQYNSGVVKTIGFGGAM